MKARKSLSVQRRTIGYVRASTDDQSITLDAQQARIASYCSAMAWEGLEVIQDAGESGSSLKRPGMQAVLDAVRRGEIDRIIVTKLDRLTRSVRDLATLFELTEKHGTALVSISDSLDSSSATGRMVANMIATVSQWELEIIRERTAAALSHKRGSRKVYGPVPFGFQRSGDSLVPHPEEQPILREAVRMDKAGKSFREIGRYMTTMGARSRVWAAGSVRAVLRSRMALEAV